MDPGRFLSLLVRPINRCPPTYVFRNIFAGSRDVCLWDPDTGRCINKIESGFVATAACAAPGRRILMATSQNALHCMEVTGRQGKECLQATWALGLGGDSKGSEDARLPVTGCQMRSVTG